MPSISSYNEVSTNVLPKISVFGVGGAGKNAVNNMILSQPDGIKFIVANTDRQSLMNSLAETKIQLGIKCTKGLGAGSDPEVGKQSAEEACDIIRRELADVNMLFIATGMGGGTGTGASPVIAKIAKDMGILTIAIAIKPLILEGRKRMETAKKGIKELEKIVDTLIVIENQKLMELDNASMFDNYAIADSILRQSVYCVVNILSKQGFINRDFADVRTVLSCAGRAVIGYGEDTDPKVATDIAIHNKVLENSSIHGAKNILVNISGGRNIKPADIEEVVNKIRDEAVSDRNEEPNIIFGIVLDEDLGNKISVSVIASGVNSEQDSSAGENIDDNRCSKRYFIKDRNEDLTRDESKDLIDATTKITDSTELNDSAVFCNGKKDDNEEPYEGKADDCKSTTQISENISENAANTEIFATKKVDQINSSKILEFNETNRDVVEENANASADFVEHEKVEAPIFVKPINEDDLEDDESFNLQIEDIISYDNNCNLNENLIPFQENHRSYEKRTDNGSTRNKICKQNFNQKQRDNKNLQFGLFEESEPKKAKSFLSKFIDSIGGSVPEIDTNDVNVCNDVNSQDVDFFQEDIYDLPAKRKIG